MDCRVSKGPCPEASSLSCYLALLTPTSLLTNDARAGPDTGPRVALFAPPGRAYVEGMWATWLAGGISVPLCLTHPTKSVNAHASTHPIQHICKQIEAILVFCRKTQSYNISWHPGHGTGLMLKAVSCQGYKPFMSSKVASANGCPEDFTVI